MEVEAKIKEFQELAAELAKEETNFKKDGIARKTPEYKQKKIAKAVAINERINVILNELDKLLVEPDNCLELEKTNFKLNYGNYIKLLQQIPDGQKNQSNEDEEKMEVLRFAQKQNVRFEGLRKIIEDVDGKVEIGLALSTAFCRMKLNAIKDIWERVQTADEEVETDRTKLPANYTAQIIDYEQQVDRIGLMLQTELDRQTAAGSNSRSNNDDVKLPRVTIAKFKGDYFEWTSFRDLFTTMVKDKTNLSNVQKMQMLKTLLDGEAEKLISDLTISEVNFDSAWDRLLERYDNNRVVVYKHLCKLITQQQAKNDSKALKRLLDTTDQILLALRNLGRPVDSWDDWIIITITQKLNEDTRKDWERKIGDSKNLPTWDQLKKFLGEQFRMMEGLENSNRNHPQKNSTEKTDSRVVKSYQATINQKGCPACEGEHKLFSCTTFKTMEVAQRWELAKKQKLCFSCLQRHEDKLKCDKKNPCKKCKRRHSTWLHESKIEATKEGGQGIKNAHGRVDGTRSHGLLATCLVLAHNNDGNQFFLRALLDSGSQASMITTKAAEMLNINMIQSSNFINVLGGSNTGKTKIIQISIEPRFSSNEQLQVECYVMNKLTEPLPNKDIDITKWKHLRDLTLADPMFNNVGSIDLLLGADVIGEILLPNIVRGRAGTPMAQETTFGWIVSGRFDASYERKTISCFASTLQENEEIELTQFWEIEDLTPKRLLTMDEQECENFYQRTYKKNSEGKFIVKIPFKSGQMGPERLGESRGQCMARFLYLEKRFQKDDALKKEYVRVMQEYLQLGHMTEVDDTKEKLYYIPHHAVVKPDSLTTKTRVVFDASAKTTTGVSLNTDENIQFTGGKQQDDLLVILIRWRKYAVVFKADIEKMYRMIKLDGDDQRYHTILWRSEPTEPIKEYQLNTVTFGTAAAPFMATRTLNQIANDIKDKYPSASNGIVNGFYVDDLIYGCETVEDSINCKDEINTALNECGLSLRKWTSNSEKFLATVPTEFTERSLQSFDEDDSTKALGLRWNPRTDTFGFAISWHIEEGELTKRKLLSQASKLFDPLGWCAPVILLAKLMMQEVWNAKIGWDELVPQHIKNQWNQLRDELNLLSQLKIDRWIGFNKNDKVQLHGFSDASEKAYSAVVYTRVEKEGKIEVKLIAAKTRVAPIKTKTTLPRMELCGAVLLAHLMTATKEALQLEELPMIAWSDSTVTLGWLKGEPLKWKTFVANRTSEIQSTLVNDWRYCPSESNPADCASRGIMPEELLRHPLWWTGPPWLKENEEYWPKLNSEINVDESELEQRKVMINVARVERNTLLLGTSSWFRKLRVLAYCLRMKTKQSVGARLTVKEIEKVKIKLLKQCQQEAFPEEVHKLQKEKAISTKSQLLSLNPFLDDNGILRVGGRLRNAMLSFENKHPIILPSMHETTKMIIKQMHLDTLHGGPQLMLALLRKKYWIINGKRTVTNEWKRCLNCKRLKGETTQQKMGDLPVERVTLERAFLFSGVDYCGPIEVRSSKLRNAKLQKGYIAVFVCLGTRASHLELVSDMSTAAFLAAFNRFIARRGTPRLMYSDNGTNFVGAYNKLARDEKQWLHEKNSELASLVVHKGIDWKFIPPGAPNVGGIWERNVRSVKEHLKRTLKTVRLTFEEYGTLLCQIEACLNSRPLSPLTTDVENLNALTPGHFLIGESLMAPPELSLGTGKIIGMDRWRLIQTLKQQFWQKWNQEYLVQLQQRHKWKKGEVIVNQGDLVLVKDEQLPPQHWLMGRIEEKWPGKDGIVRVVTIRTHKGIIKRPINKICSLMSNQELEDDDKRDPDEQPEERNHEIELHDLGPDVRECEPDKPIDTVKLVKPSKAKVDHAGSRYNLRSRIPNMTTLVVVLGIIIMLGGGSALEKQEMVKISNFQNNAGIYFEELGRAQTVKTQWKIYIRFDLLRYRKDVKRLRLIEDNLSELCMGMNSQSSRGNCEDTTGLIDQQLTRIEELNSLLGYNGDEDQLLSRRRRAAPIAAIGWIQHEIFGVMASQQAEEINQQFEAVARDAQYTKRLLRNQTSIIDSTVNLMKTTQTEINRNYERIERQIDIMKNETDAMKRRMKVISLTMYTLAFVSRIGQIQENILDMITDLHQGHVSSHVFSPDQFKEQLGIMKNHLPMDSIVPEIAQHDIKSLYKIIKGSARVAKNYIVLEIIFPLVSNVEFQLWHVVPIPTKHDKNQITIIPDAEYLMMSLKRDSFYIMTARELHTCLRPREKMFICTMKHLLYTAKSTVGLCERELLNNQLELSPSCKMKVTPEMEFWIRLNYNNQWIYGTKKPTTLNVVCGTASQQIVLNGSGILEIMPGCEVNQPGMTIIAESVKQTNGNFNYYPQVNLSEAVMRSGRINETTGMKIINLTIDHNEQLNQLATQIHELDAQTQVHTVYHMMHSGGNMGCMLIIIAISFMIWFNKTRIMEFMATWKLTKTEVEPNNDHDVELNNISTKHGRSELHHSSDVSTNDDSTINSHKGGRCPFRT